MIKAFVKGQNDFDPKSLGQSLCMNFDLAVSTFEKDPKKRLLGGLGSYIYDFPQFPDDQVTGGVHYNRYVKRKTSLIPQRQPVLLKAFAESIVDVIGRGGTFDDIGVGPRWSALNNTVPALGVLRPDFYRAVDKEREFSQEAVDVVEEMYSDVKATSIGINFHQSSLPWAETDKSIVWYPGSTMGNLPRNPDQTYLENPYVDKHLRLFKEFANDSEKHPAHRRYIAVLMDRKKENQQKMIDLYVPHAEDCFRSILFKLKRDLEAKNFDPMVFDYIVRWDEQSSTIEHVFKAAKTQKTTISDPFSDRKAGLEFIRGEEYVVGNSMKPTPGEQQQKLVRAGLYHHLHKEDPEKLFHMHLASFDIPAAQAV